MWPAIVTALVLFWVLRRAGRDRRERDRFLADVIAEYERVIHEYNLAAQAEGRPPYEVNAAVQGGPDDTAHGNSRSATSSKPGTPPQRSDSTCTARNAAATPPASAPAGTWGPDEPILGERLTSVIRGESHRRG
ncbi:MAG TPA: hypothetical protein VIJ23_07095, partial [Mycobacterium sp.]